jgi:hypothetical protein
MSFGLFTVVFSGKKDLGYVVVKFVEYTFIICCAAAGAVTSVYQNVDALVYIVRLKAGPDKIDIFFGGFDVGGPEVTGGGMSRVV